MLWVATSLALLWLARGEGQVEGGARKGQDNREGRKIGGEEPPQNSVNGTNRAERNDKRLLHSTRWDGGNITLSQIKVDGDERTVRRGDGGYVPFNSMTFSSGVGGVTEASQKRQPTVPWWKKLKNNKNIKGKKGNKAKSKKKKKKEKQRNKQKATTRKPSQYPKRTARPTKQPMKASTTWFPITFTSTVAVPNYFTRPVVHDSSVLPNVTELGLTEDVMQEQQDDISAGTNVLKDALTNSIFPADHNDSDDMETKEQTRKRLPTLTEVAGLFDDFYSYVEYYPWKLEVDTVKRLFIKILEDYSSETFDNKKKLMKYLQKKVFLWSKSQETLSLDAELYRRYSFIVGDLANRKITSVKKHDKLVTKSTTSSSSSSTKSVPPKSTSISHKKKWIINNRIVLADPSVQEQMDDTLLNDNIKQDPNGDEESYNLIKSFFSRPNPSISVNTKWNTEKTTAPYYPQNSALSSEEQLNLQPMFGTRPAGPVTSLGGLFASTERETGTGNTTVNSLFAHLINRLPNSLTFLFLRHTHYSCPSYVMTSK